MKIERHNIGGWFQQLQDDICDALSKLDGGADFRTDHWDRAGGGGGRSRVIAQGGLIEKGGVNWSGVHGELPVRIKAALGVEATEFYATGVSIVLHPRNPHVPIIHMNVRFFELNDHEWWFGGGIDLTPHYVVPTDARYFHQSLKAVCDHHDPTYYPKFKRWADEYFFIKHRNETRGVGGIFFDRLGSRSDQSRAEVFPFVQDVGRAFVPIYSHLATLNRELPYGERELEWQAMRRSRYVEFNLVWDKGTRFGLDTDGRTESILMSMPPLAKWVYDHAPQPGSREADTLNWLGRKVDWLT